MRAVDPHGKMHGKGTQGKKKAAASGSSQRVTRATLRKRAASDNDEADDEADAQGDQRPRKKQKPSSRKSQSPPKAPSLLLATKWDVDSGIDPTGWWVSEKLDGVRYVLIKA